MTRETLKFETESDFDPNDLGGASDLGGEGDGFRGAGWGADGDRSSS